MTTILSQTEIQLDRQGRLVIPSAFRQALGLESGDHLIVHIENVGKS